MIGVQRWVGGVLKLEQPKKSRAPSEHQPTARAVATSRFSSFDTRVKLLVHVTLCSFSAVSSLAVHSVASITVEVPLRRTMPADIRSFFGGKPAQLSQENGPAKVEVRFTQTIRIHLSSDAQAGKKIKGPKTTSNRR